MTSEQFEILVELLKSIDSKLSNIEGNTGGIDSNVSYIDGEVTKIKKIMEENS